jgi:hypothetical protein
MGLGDEKLAGKQALGLDSAQVLGLQGKIDRLTERVDTLTHANRALWRMLCEKLNLSEDDLKARMKQMRDDLEAERNNTKPATPCPSCGRPLVKGRNACVYCGTEHVEGDAFDGVL